LTDVTTTANGDATIIRLTLTRPVQYQIHYETPPNQVIISLQNVKLGKGVDAKLKKLIQGAHIESANNVLKLYLQLRNHTRLRAVRMLSHELVLFLGPAVDLTITPQQVISALKQLNVDTWQASVPGYFRVQEPG